MAHSGWITRCFSRHSKYRTNFCKNTTFQAFFIAALKIGAFFSLVWMQLRIVDQNESGDANNECVEILQSLLPKEALQYDFSAIK